MRAIAILGPGAVPAEVGPFCLGGVQVEPVSQARAGADVALILGGDGTLNRHLPGLIENRIRVLVVPRGSGNDFAGALGIRTPRQALETWHRFLAGKGKLRDLDAGLIVAQGQGPRLFSTVAGLGLGAEANRRANRMPPRLRRNGGYVLAALRALPGFRAPLVRITSAACSLEEEATLVAWGNTARYGGGVPITPEADPGDGLLDMCFVRRMAAPRLLLHLPSVLTGRHTRLPQVAYVKAEEFEVECEPPVELHADGEPAGRTPVVIRVLRGVLPVVT